MSILEEVCFGPFFFQVAVMLRNSLFLSSILINSEVWYNLSNKNIQELEIVDHKLLRRVLECPQGTPTCMMYLELGCVPLRFLIKNRRILFLQYILQQDKESLILKFFNAQNQNPLKGDWVLQVLQDLTDFEIKMTFEEIQSTSKYSFKCLVKKAMQTKAFEWLEIEKDKLSKVKNVNFSKLQIQDYLLPNSLEMKQQKLLFQLRTRMVELKSNFKRKHNDNLCPICHKDGDDQTHLLQCSELINGLNLLSEKEIILHEDIFSEIVEKQARVTRLFESLFNFRKKLLEHIIVSDESV